LDDDPHIARDVRPVALERRPPIGLVDLIECIVGEVALVEFRDVDAVRRIAGARRRSKRGARSRDDDARDY